MKIVQINCTSGKGSTGKICEGISAVLTENNIDNIIIYSEGSTNLTNAKRLNSDRYRKIQALKSRIFGNYGFNSNLLTKKIIKELEQFKRKKDKSGMDATRLLDFYGLLYAFFYDKL